MMAFVAIPAFVVGDPMPVLQLFLTAATPILTAIAVLNKSQVVEKAATESTEARKVSESTDQKVDQLLNGSLQGKVARLEQTALVNASRIGHIEGSVVEILAVVRRLDSESPNSRADRLDYQRPLHTGNIPGSVSD
jgi:hypothetical protein